MTHEKNWFSYKNNQLISISMIGVVAATGILIYVKRQKNLFEAISKKIRDVKTVTGGADDLATQEYWNPKIFLSRKDISQPTIDRIAASKYAQQIHDSVGMVKDNEDVGLSIFKKFNNQADVAMVADRYTDIFKGTLLAFLQKNYSAVVGHNYVKDIYDVVKNLPI